MVIDGNGQQRKSKTRLRQSSHVLIFFSTSFDGYPKTWTKATQTLNCGICILRYLYSIKQEWFYYKDHFSNVYYVCIHELELNGICIHGTMSGDKAHIILGFILVCILIFGCWRMTNTIVGDTIGTKELSVNTTRVLVRSSLFCIQYFSCLISFGARLELVWMFDWRTLYIGSLRAKLILASQEVLKCSLFKPPRRL